MHTSNTTEETGTEQQSKNAAADHLQDKLSDPLQASSSGPGSSDAPPGPSQDASSNTKSDPSPSPPGDPSPSPLGDPGSPGGTPFGMGGPTPGRVQFFGSDGDLGNVGSIAGGGITGGATSLPHLDSIQSSFGSHDVSGVQAHTGGSAQQANADMGSEAYATGNHVAFADSSPGLHTAAHEAAHVVQQRAGVSLKGGVGAVGDRYEQHADAVADKVVRGESAESTLDQMAGPSAGESSAPVQQQAGPVQMEVSAGDRVKAGLKGALSGFFKNIFFGWHIAAWADQINNMRALDKNKEANAVYAQIGEGMRVYDMVKETVQMVANVATGVSVVLGILSIFMPPVAVGATIAGIVATAAHGLALVMRLGSLLKVRSALKTLNKLPLGDDAAALALRNYRRGELAGLAINTIGVVFGGLGGSIAQIASGDYAAGANVLVPEGVTGDAAVNATGVAMGEIGNRTQDAIGDGAEEDDVGFDEYTARIARERKSAGEDKKQVTVALKAVKDDEEVRSKALPKIEEIRKELPKSKEEVQEIIAGQQTVAEENARTQAVDTNLPVVGENPENLEDAVRTRVPDVEGVDTSGHIAKHTKHTKDLKGGKPGFIERKMAKSAESKKKELDQRVTESLQAGDVGEKVLEAQDRGMVEIEALYQAIDDHKKDLEEMRLRLEALKKQLDQLDADLQKLSKAINKASKAINKG